MGTRVSSGVVLQILLCYLENKVHYPNGSVYTL